ncbi:hypothetical protein [Marinobacterium weihaiense]|uniref:Uncharacterized protein n=1 Tax=Marinobacterium weihaiense TaxID=2851016 RepID=A0ABS6MCY0_9GAMM|nr:hypothetical protein [Marinobacterium weihaiense]MBV0934145.1 hypothetical protein [Marinobacterium weihaiense]
MPDKSLQAQPKLHIYGGSAALCLEGSFRGQGEPTVNIDVAPKPDGRNVDWSRKITVQLSHNELTVITGIMLGYAQTLQCGRPDKGINLSRQPGKVYVSASAGSGQIYGVPLTVGDTAKAADFLLARVTLGSFTGSVEASIASVRGACALLRNQ